MNNLKFLQTIIKLFFEHITIMKMFHFQTKLYGTHKIVDSYLSKFLLNMEVGQGQYGIITNEHIKINCSMITDSNVNTYLDQIIEKLNIIGVHAFVNNQSLINIKDDMITDIAQLKYLLNFK